MKSARRHELESNQLATLLTAWGVKVQPYARMILGAAILALAVLLSVWYVSGKRSESQAVGWDVYARAINTGDMENLRELAKEAEGSVVGDWATLAVADHDLSFGADVFARKADAPKYLQDAARGYAALRDSSDRMLRQKALYGAARAHESLVAFSESPKEMLARAISEYEMLASEYPDGPFAQIARARAADLKLDSTKSFYEWLTSWQPPLDFKKEPGTPGKTDLDDKFELPIEEETSAAAPPSEPAEKPADAESRSTPANESSREADAEESPATTPSPPDAPAGESGAGDTSADDASDGERR